MKELSIEEKAKRYDEAIEKLRSLHDNHDTVSTLIGIKEELENLFPELKESEDERIRKQIIAFATGAYKGEYSFIPYQFDKWIAYLEKQGEQKFVESDLEFDAFVRWFVRQRTDNYTLIPSDETVHQWAEMILEHARKVKQKPVEDNPCKDCINRKGCINCENGELRETAQKSVTDKIEAITDGLKTEFQKQVSYLITSVMNREHAYTQGYVEWVAQSLLGYARNELEQKPEWSEEDKQFLLVCKNALAKYQVSDKWDAGIISRWLENRLKYLCPQPKVEWSEEDEKYSSYICAALECYYRLREDRNNTNGQEDLDKARNWLHNKLKSLRPQTQWKPSDGQMEALKEAVDAEIVEVEDNNCSMCAYTHLEICTDEDLSKICKAGDKAKVIIIKQK